MSELGKWPSEFGLSPSDFAIGVYAAIWSIYILGIISFFYVVKRRRAGLFILSVFVPPIFLVFLFLALVKLFKRKSDNQADKTVKSPEDLPPWTFALPLTDGNSIQIPNPFRGIFITGGAGAGKSKSLIEPLIYQSVEKEYTGLLYDYENPVLARYAWSAFRNAQTPVKDFYVNFTDLNRSHRLNPLDPRFMTSSSHAREYSSTIFTNLLPETINRKDFWTRNTESAFAAIMWFLREVHPEYCTLPHAVSLALADDLEKLLNLISQNEECAGMVASIKAGLKSENQTAGIMATLQNSLAGINTPEIFWVLSGGDLTLDLNNPKEPKFLSIGNDPGLVDTYSPVVSLIISAALKLLNRPGQHHSVVLVDELPTVYIPNLDRIPATARKNKVATVLCVQDFSQLEDKYGEKKTEVIISVLANQFYGKTTNPKTGERISRIYGKYDQQFITEAESESQGRSSGGSFLGSFNRSQSYSRSTTIQERPRVKPQDLVSLKAGEFYGTLVDSDRAEFRGQFRESDVEPQEIEAFKIVSEDEVKENFGRIKEEAKAILEGRARREDRDGG